MSSKGLRERWERKRKRKARKVVEEKKLTRMRNVLCAPLAKDYIYREFLTLLVDDWGK